MSAPRSPSQIEDFETFETLILILINNENIDLLVSSIALDILKEDCHGKTIAKIGQTVQSGKCRSQSMRIKHIVGLSVCLSDSANLSRLKSGNSRHSEVSSPKKDNEFRPRSLILAKSIISRQL